MGAQESSTDEIIYTAEDGLAQVIFNRPQARNAFTFAMYERVRAICEAANADASLRAIILTGAGGKAFGSGTDISQFRVFAEPADAIAYEARMELVLSALERCRVPTIAAIAGVCTGGGLAIAGCCDLRIATRDARLGFPIARTLGNCLSPANYARFVGLIGAARLKEIVFRARLVGAAEAAAIGLVHEVVADATALEARALEIAREIAGYAPLTLQATKEALRRLQPELPADAGHDLIVKCYMSADFREGMEAFLGKRPPRWQGR